MSAPALVGRYPDGIAFGALTAHFVDGPRSAGGAPMNLPDWWPLAARSALAIRSVKHPWPDDMTGACMVAAVLLAMVGAAHGVDVELVSGEAFDSAHNWNRIDGRVIDLTVSQFGYPWILHTPKPWQAREYYRATERAALGDLLFALWRQGSHHPSDPRYHHGPLAAAYSWAVGVPMREARRRVRAVVGPELRS